MIQEKKPIKWKTQCAQEMKDQEDETMGVEKGLEEFKGTEDKNTRAMES